MTHIRKRLTQSRKSAADLGHAEVSAGRSRSETYACAAPTEDTCAPRSEPRASRMAAHHGCRAQGAARQTDRPPARHMCTCVNPSCRQTDRRTHGPSVSSPGQTAGRCRYPAARAVDSTTGKSPFPERAQNQRRRRRRRRGGAHPAVMQLAAPTDLCRQALGSTCRQTDRLSAISSAGLLHLLPVPFPRRFLPHM